MVFRQDMLNLALKTAGRETLRYWYIANTFTADTGGLFTIEQFQAQLLTITGQIIQKHLIKSRLKSPFFVQVSPTQWKSVGRRLLGCTKRTHRHPLTLEDLASKGSFTELCAVSVALRDRFVPYRKIMSATGVSQAHAKRLVNQAIKKNRIKKTNNHVILSRGTIDQIHCYRQHLMAQGVITLPPERTAEGPYILKSFHANVYNPVSVPGDAHESTVRTWLPIRKDCWIRPYNFTVNKNRETAYQPALTWEFNTSEAWDKWSKRRGL